MSAQTTVFTFPRISSLWVFDIIHILYSIFFIIVSFYQFLFFLYFFVQTFNVHKEDSIWGSIIYCFKMTLQTTHYELGFWYNKVIHKSFFLETDLLLGKLRWNTLKPSLDYFNFCIQFDVNKKCYYLEFLFEIGKFHPIGYHHILNLEFSKWGVNPKSSLLYQFLKTI